MTDAADNIIPTWFDGEIGGFGYPDDDLDARHEAFVAEARERAGDAAALAVADFIDKATHEPDFWVRAKALCDELVERESRRRLVMSLDIAAVAQAHRAYVDKLLDDTSLANSGGIADRVATRISYVLTELAHHDGVDPAARSRFAHLADEVTR